MSEGSIKGIVENYDCLNTFLQSKVDTISGISSTSQDFLLISSAIDNISEHRQVAVASSTELPDIKYNNISNGQIIFVEDRLIPVVANNECWLGLDGRVLRSDAPTRTLFTWGPNTNGVSGVGVLGDGTTLDRCSPGTTAGCDTTWCQVSGGYRHSAAIKTNGTLWTWGCNICGTLGDGTTLDRSSPGTVVGGDTNWCQVSISNALYFTTAIKTDGTLWTWGRNFGNLGEGTVNNRCSPGTVAGGGTTWCQVTGGSNFTTAIKTDGTLWTWGCNCLGRLGDGTTVNRSSPGTIFGGGTTWCQVSNGSNFTAAIKTNGTLWSWGINCCGRLGDGTTLDRCSPGTVAGSGTSWCQTSSGSNFSAAIKTDGTLWTWGCNGTGRLGGGTTVNRCSPGTIAGGGTNWCQVSGGNLFTGAIKTDGTLWTWGYNGLGRLGDGTTLNRCSPGTIAGGGIAWCQVSGYRHMLALQVQ